MSESLTKDQIDRVLGDVAIPRHWHSEPIKRRGITRQYIEVHELEEIVSAVIYNVREDLRLALAGIYRDECPECEKPLNLTDHAECNI